MAMQLYSGVTVTPDRASLGDLTINGLRAVKDHIKKTHMENEGSGAALHSSLSSCFLVTRLPCSPRFGETTA